VARQIVPVGELLHIQLALDSLENRLRDLKEFFFLLERRRGLLNAGGSILKILFGTLTVADLDELHATVDALHKKEDTIVHAINQQVTYLKQLDGTVRSNVQAIENLTDTLREVALKAQEGFQDVEATLTWYHKQREAATAIRQLEFALSKLEFSIDELMDALQFVSLGKVPLNLIGPKVLREMLKSVAMILPEGYELIAGVSPNNIFLYYEMIQAMMLVDAHRLNLVLYVPLKTVNRHFELFKIAVFSTSIFNNTYARFVVEKEYLAINSLQRTYFTMSSSEISQCKGKHVMICPASQAVYTMEVDSCNT
jgi:hypothetical protein